VDVLDRTALILHIFAQHARSREGQLQVELAQYRYLLPRLTGRGVELSRMGAASRGGTGVNVRGPGETKLETDRRRIRRRISELNREIEAVRSQRAQSRRERRLSGIPVVALAGYTNAGKSTLLNALTGAGVLSSDQLFATLDPTTRRVHLPGGQEILLTDTVGFIQKLPSDLVAAFRATLEEIVEADLILHVVDASHPQVEEQAEAVEDELEDLGVAGRARLTVLNKADLVPAERLSRLAEELGAGVAVSALKGEGIEQLETSIATAIAAAFVPVEVRIPFAASSLVGLFRTRGMVDVEQHDAGGTHITGRLPAALLPSFRPYFS
jgi:GTP-binding protein HflX